MRRLVLGVLLATASMGGSMRPLGAQGVEETRMLREAAARESRGDFEGAERVLRRLLETSPSSSGGLFALERVLRSKGDVQAILPAVDTFLAHDSSASGVRYLKLRVLVETDSLAGVEQEAEAWLRAQPGSESAYREVSRIYDRAWGPDRALQVLRRGREALRRPDAYALEIGDLLAAGGDLDGAVKEWATAVGPDGAQAPQIGRRVAGLPRPEKVREAGGKLVEVLGGSDDPGRRRAGALIALDLKLAPPALALSRDVAGTLRGRARVSFLTDVARRARDADLTEVATWAYGELGQNAQSPAERRQFDQRLVEVSLAEGDTAAALEAQRRVVSSFTAGSVDRRRATAEALRLESRSASPDRLKELLGSFRSEFPDAPELDEVAAGTAGALLARGDEEGAATVLEGIEGPRSALQRGYLLLGAGDVAEGRRALLLALPGLPPADATEVIQFIALLGRLSPAGSGLLADAGVKAREGHPDEAAASVREGLPGVPEEERPALLAEAARMAERAGADSTAADLRTTLVEDHPESPESAEASLSLARWYAARPDGRDEAIRLLEELVLSRPNAAVVPDARRELDRLRRQGS